MNTYSKLLVRLFCASTFLFITGCSEQFSRIGSNVLSSTGLISGSQANAIFAVGNKLSKATESVTDEQEYYVGRAVAGTILERYRPESNRSATAYLNKIAAVLAARSTRPETFGGYHVAILNTPSINAVSAPGGYIFVSKGFLSLLKTEDQLAAILAHEIAHVALKHGLSTISESNLTDALQIVGKEAASMTGNSVASQLNSLFGDSVNEITGALLDKGYSRGQEYDADEYAQTLLRQAGYNPEALAEALTLLEHVTTPAGGWFETHPSAEDRKDELKAVTGDDATKKGEQKRAARFKRSVG